MALLGRAPSVYDTGNPWRARGGRHACGEAAAGESDLTEELIGKFGYVGIALILILGGLGLPIPEEAPIILAAVLTRNGQMSAPLALASCLGGVLLGDFVVYLLGYLLRREGPEPAADPPTPDAAAGGPDQGLFPPARLQDPGLRPVRPGLPHGRLPDRRDPQAARR